MVTISDQTLAVLPANKFTPDITLIIPFRNEEEFLAETLETLSKQQLHGYCAEILLIDGMSLDQSYQIAQHFVALSTNVLVFRLLQNPGKITPKGFNLGIQAAQSSIIGFGGAHTLYPSHYLWKAINILQEFDADVVGGGHTEIIPSAKGIINDAMSCLYQSFMGAGVAAYHQLDKPSYVDTVYGGFYKRTVFETIGYFNESLIRNQDNELNSRVTSAGFKILYHNDLSTTYIQKTTLAKFFKRAYDFGYYHPTTWLANPNSFRIRHVVPFAWLIYIISLIPIVLWLEIKLLYLLPAVLYLLLLIIAAIRLSSQKSVLSGVITAPLFFVYHILYGTGTLLGFFKVLSTARNSH